MAQILDRYADEALHDHPILGDQKVLALRKDRERIVNESGAGGEEWFQVTMYLAKEELRQGNLDRGIELAESARQWLTEGVSSRGAPARIRVLLHYDLGIAYMRRAETSNCCARNDPEGCILPIRGGGVHRLQDDSREAIRCFTTVLKLTKPADAHYQKSRWLLNLLYMAIGGYPEQVPDAYRIPVGVFQSEVQIPRFKNVAPDLSVSTLDLLGGVVADDFDGDGYPDIMVSTWDPAGSLRLYRNNGDGSFSDDTTRAGLDDVTGGFNLIQADYDNDGDLDLYVMRGGWAGEAGRIPNSLLENDGSGKFKDVTFEAGMGEIHLPSQTAAWADYDNDGHLDLYVGNEHNPDATPAPCQLYRNNGNGTFTDVAEAAGVENLRFAKGVVWGDYDADGDQDLYVSNFLSKNRLYRNEGDGSFIDVAEKLGVAGPVASFSVWFWDYNNDGALDLFVAGYDYYEGNLSGYVKSRLGLKGDYVLPALYRGDGKGGFEDVGVEMGLDRMTLPMGANFGDLDNDGYPDFYLGTGYPDYEALMPSVMYLNRSGTNFADVTTAGGFGHLQKGHGVAFVDFDHDGDHDVYEQMGGFYRGDQAYNAFYRNPGFGNHWISVDLVGSRSNRSAIGARIHVLIEEGGRSRSIFRYVNSGGSFGGNPLRQTIGLGSAERIVRMEILWPATGVTQTVEDLQLDSSIHIVEGQKGASKQAF